MADKRRARRESDPGLQPERTSLAWFRTLLGYGALMALAIKHSWHRAGLPFWLSAMMPQTGQGSLGLLMMLMGLLILLCWLPLASRFTHHQQPV